MGTAVIEKELFLPFFSHFWKISAKMTRVTPFRNVTPEFLITFLAITSVQEITHVVDEFII